MKSGVGKKARRMLKKQMLVLMIVSMILSTFTSLHSVGAAEEVDYELAGTVAHYPLNSTYQYKNKLNESQLLSGSDPAWRSEYVSLVNPGNANNGHIAGTNPGAAITGDKISFSLNVKLNKTQTRSTSAQNTLFSFGANNDNNITLRPYYSNSMAAVVLKQNGTDAVVASFPKPAADIWHNYTISLDGTANSGKLTVWVDGVKAAEVASNGIGADEIGNGQFRLNRTISTFSNLDSHYRDVRIISGAVDEDAALALANETRSFAWSDLLATNPMKDGLVARHDITLLADPNFVWSSSDSMTIDPSSGAVTRPERGSTTKEVILTLNWFDYSQDYTIIVPPYDAGDNLIANFNFDDASSGLIGGGAKATVQGTASYSNSFEGNGKAANISSNFWLNVTKEDGITPLLQGLNEFTISYDSKTSGGSGWAFFAAPNTTTQTYLNERYIGVIDLTNSLAVERYNNSGSRPDSAQVSSSMEWKHVDVVISVNDTQLYVDGELKATVPSSHALSNILTATGGVVQIGKGNWGAGEYYTGLIDNFQIFNKALTQEELLEYRITNIPPVITPAGGQIYTPVTITHSAGNKYIYYTTDGTDPTLASTQYTGPFEVEQGTTIKAAAIAPNGQSSEIKTVHYYGSTWAATAQEFRLKGQETVNNVKISWPIIAGASYYEVSRGDKLIDRVYGDTVDEYGLEVGKAYTYTVKAFRDGIQLALAQSNTVETFTYNTAAVTEKKDNYTGVSTLGQDNPYGVKVDDVWYHYVYNTVRDAATAIATTSIYEQTSTDGRNYSNDRLLGSFDDMRVEGEGYKFNPTTGKIVFMAHEEASSAYTRAHLFIAAATPGGDDFAATFRGRPFDKDSRDMVSFIDEDNSAYIVFATRGNNDLAIIKLDASWEQPEEIVNTIFEGNHKESPSIMKHDGRYYFYGSTANGWYPSQAEYASADSLDGEWTPLSKLGNSSTYATQGNGISKWVGANGREVIVANGFHWGAQYAEGFKDPMGTYARLFPAVLHNGIATADWFYQLDWDEQYGIIPVQSGQFLSLGKKATDSQGLDATAVTDGADLSTAATVQHSALPYNIVIDLEQLAQLSEINLTTRVVPGSDTVYRYKLEGSVDNVNWTQLVDGSQNNVVGFVTNPITNTGHYRYVRLTVSSIINVHNNQGATWADGIIELAVYGTPHVNKSLLEAKYEEKKDTEQGNYADATWAKITQALHHAEAVLADGSTSQWIVDRAVLQIDEAFKWALTVNPNHIVDYSDLGMPMGETWYDTEGNPIQAHGGGFLQQTHEDGKPIYYWVGENKIHNSAVFHAVALYSSRDLVNWTYEGDIVDQFTETVEGAEYTLVNNKWERPKLLYNEKTQKYVLWGHWETAGSYASSQIVVATADHVAGPYTVLGHWRPGGTLRNWRTEGGQVLDSEYFKTSGVKADIPADVQNDVTKMGYTSRDFTVFMDDDKVAYLVSAEGHSMRVHRLNEDYTDVDFTTYTFSDPATKAEDFESYSFYDGVGREAPAVVRAENGYYMASSGQSGWLPNQGTISYTTDLTDAEGWTMVRSGSLLVDEYAFGNNSTYYSQPTNIMKLTNAQGENTYVYMGDRWRIGQLVDSRYVWLPMTLDEENGKASISFNTGWKLNAETGEVVVPESYLVSENKPATITNNNGVTGIEKANDGYANSLSLWGDSTHFFGGLTAPYEYTIDLGAIYDLSRIDVAYRMYNGSEMYHGYQILASQDNVSWTELADKNNNIWAGFTSDKLNGSYRYVKLKVNSVRNVHNNNLSNGWGSGLVEVQVYANSIDPIDKAALSAKIAAAQEILLTAEAGTEPGQYPEEAMVALAEAVTAAQAVVDKENATIVEIVTALESLDDAIEMFYEAIIVVPEIDKEALSSLIAEAQELIENAEEGSQQGQYLKEAIDALIEAIAAAQAIEIDSSATQTEVIEAGESLAEAIIVFEQSVNVALPADKGALHAKISEAEQLLLNAEAGAEPGQYPAVAIDVLIAQVAVAQAVIDDEQATEATIAEAVASLTEAVAVFQAAINPDSNASADKEALRERIAEAQVLLAAAEEGTEPGQYPVAAINELEDAIEAAQIIEGKEDAGQEEVDNAASSITNAIALFQAAVNPDPNASVDKEALRERIAEAQAKLAAAEEGTEPGQYPAVAIDELAEAIKAAQVIEGKEDASQEEIDNAASSITNAIALFQAAVNVDNGGSNNDTLAPAWPLNSAVTASSVRRTSLILTWDAAEDNVAVTQYRITWNGGNREVAGDVYSVSLTGLRAGTSYTFKVEAGDEAGNWSENGPSITLSTQRGVSVNEEIIPEPVDPQTPEEEGTETPVEEEPTIEQPQIKFVDVSGHWAEEAITIAAGMNIVKGHPDQSFKPNEATTRAQFMQMLANAFQWSGEVTSLPFQDQDEIGTWARNAVAQGIKRSIIGGYPDGSFRPNQEITRVEMAIMLARAFGLTLEDIQSTNFADDNVIPKWGKGAVEALREQGIVTGRGNNSFAPNEVATRAEAIVIILRVMELSSTEKN